MGLNVMATSGTQQTGTFDNSGSRETISQLTQEVERLRRELSKVCGSKSVSFVNPSIPIQNAIYLSAYTHYHTLPECMISLRATVDREIFVLKIICAKIFRGVKFS